MSNISPVPEITPHPGAPLFSRSDGVLTLMQILSETASGNFPTTEEFRNLLRQAGYVNLWFFLKVIASYSGPFESLTPTLHLDMANFWQRYTNPGDRGAMFIPRSHYKSTITTEGGVAWRINRNPNERIRISAATYEKAQGFMLTIKALHDSNDLFGWVYPEAVPRPNQRRWNDKEIVRPDRTRTFREPSVLPGGAGGSAEGLHFTGHVLDDPFGEKALNAARGSGAEMENIKNWFWTNLPSLLVSPRKSWSFVVGTRYAIDDLYGDIIQRATRIEGGNMPGFTPNPDGQWIVYYRNAIEDGTPIFSEAFTLEDFAQIAKDDFWTYATQYENNPYSSGLAEFTTFQLKSADFTSHNGEYYIVWQEVTPNGKEFDIERPLSEFDVVMAIDPAGTEKYVSAKTSRSAVVLLGTHYTGRRVVFDLKVGYFDPSELFDAAFSLGETYGKYIRASYLEANAGFRILGPLFRKEEHKRGIYLNLRTFPAMGDKDARIRNELNPVMKSGNLYVVKGHMATVEEESKVFPQSAKKDILDAISSAVKNSIIPISPEEKEMEAQQSQFFSRKTSNLTGY